PRQIYDHCDNLWWFRSGVIYRCSKTNPTSVDSFSGFYAPGLSTYDCYGLGFIGNEVYTFGTAWNKIKFTSGSTYTVSGSSTTGHMFIASDLLELPNS
ncbi:MAG: hypothetical protein LBR18_05580, partial [Tannerella sp.]|nr:hypothetical protein [Tannerella sp.]